ncbi:unnamed protein product, partial [Ectocarpus sp. 12 AP-2014]
QGDGFIKIGQAAKACICYSRQISNLGMQSDRMGLSALGVAHARLAKAQRACDRVDLAAVSFERTYSKMEANHWWRNAASRGS